MSDNNISIYKNLLYKCNSMIDSIKQLNFDVSCFNESLIEIVKTDSLSLSYSSDKLLKLIEQLEKYDVFFRIKNFISYVKCQDNKDYNKIDIKKLIEDAYRILIDLDNVYNQNEDDIISELFDTIYELIKLEIIITGRSKLFDIVKNRESDCYFLNKSIKNDVDNNVLDNNMHDDIREKVYELNSLGLSNNYVDIDLIKMLLRFEKNNSVNNINVSDKKLNEILTSYHENVEETLECVNNLNELNGYNKDLKDKCKLNLGKFYRRVIALLLFFTVSLSGGIGIHKLLKRISSDKTYTNSVTTYSDWNGLSQTTDEIYKSEFDDFVDKTYLKEYGVWEEKTANSGEYGREVKIYDVSNFEFDNIEEYVSYGIENYNVNSKTETETVSRDVQLYSEPYIEVVKNNVDTLNVNVDVEWGIYVTIGLFVYSLYICFLGMILFDFDNALIAGYFLESFDCLDKYIISKQLSKENILKLEQCYEKVMELVNSNSKLKIEFNTLYEANKYLLSNPEELYNKYMELSNKIDVSNISLEETKIKKLTK